jgi:hypothetical protein
MNLRANPDIKVGKCVIPHALAAYWESSDKRQKDVIELRAGYIKRASSKEIARIINHEYLHREIERLVGREATLGLDVIQGRYNKQMGALLI